ncbi:PP2C family protein-serine/threonine phosphatase [Ottowia sp.]|uniref:PP2C family protein-serine/threonine phosphatase n=1 Tax=Ottowia sp. TaxID=1898956 RepID=UPI003A883209
MDKGYRLNAATGIHKGDRPYQQDQVALFAHPRINGCVMGVVADGMGGRTGGRKASDQVLLTSRQLFEHFSPDSEDASALLRQIGEESHMVIRMTAVAAEQEPHSTLAAFLIAPGGECHWLHTGDSRLYHFRGSTLVRRTKDQSYVQAMVDAGEMTPDEAAVHPKSNVLLGCLGTEDDPKLDAHIIPQLQVGDSLLACTDGLWHYFTDEELGSVLHSLPPRDASEFLIDKARVRAAGAGDNLSLAIVRVERLVTNKPQVGSAFTPLR